MGLTQSLIRPASHCFTPLAGVLRSLCPVLKWLGLDLQMKPLVMLLAVLALLTTGPTAANCCLRISLRIYTSYATGSE